MAREGGRERWTEKPGRFQLSRVCHSCLLALPFFVKNTQPARILFLVSYAGANRADGHVCEWISILVKTGVFNDDSAEHKAKYVVADIAEAFRLILELEKYQL